MSLKSVFAVWTHPLFHVSIRMLLNHPEIDWLGSTSDYTIALDKILKFKPEIIIIEEEQEGRTPIKLMKNLESYHMDFFIIGLNLNDNKVNVYHHQEHQVIKADDLIRLILGDSYQEEQTEQEKLNHAGGPVGRD